MRSVIRFTLGFLVLLLAYDLLYILMLIYLRFHWIG